MYIKTYLASIRDYALFIYFQCYDIRSVMSGRGMNGDVMSGGGRNRRGGSKSRLLSPPPSGTGNTNTSSAVSSQMLQDNSIPKVRGSSAERLLSPPPVTSPGAVNGHHGKLPVD